MKLTCSFLLTFFLSSAIAQENYEIQVYGSQTQLPGTTMFELHSNYTIHGQTQMVNGVVPTNHSLHETVEITTGISSIFETGVYLFTNYTPGYGYQIVGMHLRPRVMAPTDWNWPVGVSISLEFGYQKPAYSTDTWSLEIRPIVDKQWEKLYISFNPTLEIALQSAYSNSVPTFAPNLKVDYAFFKNGGLGFEYYGDLGPINDFYPGPQQSQSIYLAYDLLNNPRWELNIGLGFGLTPATDGCVAKVILGRRIIWKKK